MVCRNGKQSIIGKVKNDIKSPVFDECFIQLYWYYVATLCKDYMDSFFFPKQIVLFIDEQDLETKNTLRLKPLFPGP